MKRIFKYTLLLTILLLPSSVLAADVEIICNENAKPSVITNSDNLFELENFVPGQTSIKTLKAENRDPSNSCRIYFKGEGTANLLTDNVHVAFENVFGNIVDSEATSNKNISDFLDLNRVEVANLAPNTSIDRMLVLTFNSKADNSLMNLNTNFDIRIISEWGTDSDLQDTEDVLGMEKRGIVNVSNSTEELGIGGPEEESEVLGTQECDSKQKMYGYVYIDQNKDGLRGENEKVLRDIEIKVYTLEEKEQVTIEDVKTNEDGYWEVYACAGVYFVEVNRDSLPNDTELFENIFEVELTSSDQEYILEIPILDTRNIWEKYWYWILLAIGGLGTIAIVGIYRTKNRI